MGKGLNLCKCHSISVTPTTDNHVSNEMLQQQDKEKIDQAAARGLLNN